MATFNIQGKIIKKGSELGVPFATVIIYEVDKSGSGFKSDVLTETYTDIHGEFSVDFSWVMLSTNQANRPDIIFKVTQMIDGAAKVIYNETPAADTRWNIADILKVTLEAEDCLASIPSPTGRAYDNMFVFTRIGNIGVNEIDITSGYAYPDINPAAPNSQSANSPFGGSLHIGGWFGWYTDAVRYKIQYSTNGTTFHDINDPLSNSYFELSPLPGNWITQSMGPFSEGGEDNLYKLPYVEQPARPWIFPDRLAVFDSGKLADKLYTFRIQGFKWNVAHTAMIPATSLVFPPSYGTVKLNIDNSPPIYQLKEILLNGSAVNVCEIAEFTTGTLSVSFEAKDNNGHLRNFSLNALYGHNQAVTPIPPGGLDTYSNHITPSVQWEGGSSTATYSSGTYPPAKMPTCAYQFRLSVTKRTTNGYGLIYHGMTDTMHITIKR
ncbi:MAG: hypothetical protein GY757_00910 [bacterium]|nr:hypothetical protein [bacterium]